MNRSKNPGYAHQWAQDVVYELYRSYPRATEYVCKNGGLSVGKLAFVLARRPPEQWNAVKLLIKRLGDWDRSCQQRELPLEYSTFVKSFVLAYRGKWPKDMQEWLTAFLSACIM